MINKCSTRPPNGFPGLPGAVARESPGRPWGWGAERSKWHPEKPSTLQRLRQKCEQPSAPTLGLQFSPTSKLNSKMAPRELPGSAPGPEAPGHHSRKPRDGPPWLCDPNEIPKRVHDMKEHRQVVGLGLVFELSPNTALIVGRDQQSEAGVTNALGQLLHVSFQP